MAFLVVPARAEPWEGLLAEDQSYCQNEVGSQEDSPHRYTRKMFAFYDSACDVRKMSRVNRMKAWTVELSCGGPGGRVAVRELLMVTGDDTLARFTEDGYLFEMTRCGS